MENYGFEKAVENTECIPNYADRIAKKINELKELNVKINIVKVPEEITVFRIGVNYEEVEKDPYTVHIADNMTPWTVLDILDTYKRYISEQLKKKQENINTRELLEQLV